MKKNLLTVIALCMLNHTLYAQKIKGSDTVLPLSQKAAEDYMKRHDATLVVTGGGSGVGISSLLAGTTEIAQASRSIKFSEKQKFKADGKNVVEVVVAYDALAIIVHPGNIVGKLTREQIEAIFRGKITNWKQLGGKDMKIIPYARETSSGTYEFFRESLLHNKNYMNGIMSMPATGAVIQSIAQTPGAIGYVGLPYLNPKVKAVKVSYDGGKAFVAPSVENARKKLYPVVRPMFYYYEMKDEKKVRPFIDYLLSDEGQAIVSNIGFVPVR
ncbi:MAG: PstS family phosphate ABC transporter substrate-binding protein [Phocaeicola sp.]|nr:PstS family phosphate ABC transporter substrate-binding protein [Prevotellaceae bacterium]MDY5938285.1 PstS family phosphate ABC transporter substrate-binding protein [Phocaeicola sp.]